MSKIFRLKRTTGKVKSFHFHLFRPIRLFGSISLACFDTSVPSTQLINCHDYGNVLPYLAGQGSSTGG